MKIITLYNFLSFIYSVYFNFRYLEIRYAIRLPILIAYNCQVKKLFKGSIHFTYLPDFGDIQIGLNATLGLPVHKSFLFINDNGKIIFSGKAKLSSGVSIRIDKGSIYVGKNTFINGNCMFKCTSLIKLGDDLLVGWNVSFFTDDGHYVIENGIIKSREKDIKIGSHVWIASDTKIAKGVIIGDNCVVAQNSLLLSKYLENNILIGGVPAKKIKENINWKK